MLTIADEAGHLMKEPLTDILDVIKKASTWWKTCKLTMSIVLLKPYIHESRACSEHTENNLVDDLDEVPMVGHIGGSQDYDIKIIRGDLMKGVKERRGSIRFVVKRNNRRMRIKMKWIKLVDIYNFN